MWMTHSYKGIHIKHVFKRLRELGFVMNTEKSILTPTKIVLLGFAISSENISLTLTDEKNKIKTFKPQMKV